MYANAGRKPFIVGADLRASWRQTAVGRGRSPALFGHMFGIPDPVLWWGQATQAKLRQRIDREAGPGDSPAQEVLGILLGTSEDLQLAPQGVNVIARGEFVFSRR